MIVINEELRERITTRFNRFVEKREEDQCWIWQGAKFRNNYGAFSITTKQFKYTTLAHRISAFISFNFDLFSDLCVLHSCDNKLCVNPEHLHPGTHADNSREAVERGRNPRFKSRVYKPTTNKQDGRLKNEPTIELYKRGFNWRGYSQLHNLNYTRLKFVINGIMHDRLIEERLRLDGLYHLIQWKKNGKEN